MMSKKLAFELVVIIFAAVVASYFYGLSVGVQNGLQLGSIAQQPVPQQTTAQPEENKYKELFLVDPFKSGFIISQDFVGMLNSIDNDMMEVEVDGEKLKLYSVLSN